VRNYWALEAREVKEAKEVEEVKEKDGWRDEFDERSTQTPSWARPPRVKMDDSTGLAIEYSSLHRMVEIGG